jgi:hypothetical protein
MQLTRVTIVLTALFAMLLPVVAANAAPNSIEINSISEVSCTSVEILFESSVPKKSLVNYVITAAVDPSVGQPKNIKKIIKTKATGLITTKIKNLNPKVAYKFSVSAKTNKGKMINSEAVEYYSLCNLMDLLSNLPADWGNPKPIQLPTPAPTSTPIAAPAFTLSSSSETRTVNTGPTGFTINSTGGAIASFAINATPPGMSFNTTTGELTGTPNTVAAATNYTITATNASGSATQTFTLTVTAVVYTVGQTGPGGGKVFYVAPGGGTFACGPTRSATCRYLEAAPTSGTNAWTDLQYVWSGNNSVEIGVTAQGTAIGTGYANTLAIVGQSGGGNTAARAGTISRAYGGPNNLTDWFLPSKDELNQLYLARTTVGGFVAGIYWSSSEYNAGYAWTQSFDAGTQAFDAAKSIANYVRPVRAF